MAYSYIDFLSACNAPQLGAFGEYVFEAKMKELGYKVEAWRGNGGDFFISGVAFGDGQASDRVLVDVKTSQNARQLRRPHVDKNDGAINVYMTISGTGAVIRLSSDRYENVTPEMLRSVYDGERRAIRGRALELEKNVRTQQEEYVEERKAEYPKIKWVRRAWDHTQRVMCCKNWWPEAFYIKKTTPQQRYIGAIVVFFRDGTDEFQFSLAYRRRDRDSINWKPTFDELDMTFEVTKEEFCRIASDTNENFMLANIPIRRSGNLKDAVDYVLAG